MAKSLSVDVQMDEILETVNDKVKAVYKTDSERVAKETVERLKSTSPRDTGSYARGWRVSKRRDGSLIVHNKTDCQLTHLLEYEHDIVNKKGRYGVSKPIKHIGPAEEWAAEELPRRIMEDLDL